MEILMEFLAVLTQSKDPEMESSAILIVSIEI